MNTPSLLRRTGCAAILGGLLAGATAASAPAGTSTLTLHYFSKSVFSHITDPAGHRLGPNVMPVPGDAFTAIDLNYAGNHKHHAKHWTATDHLRCVIVAPPGITGRVPVLCDGQIAIGGSMLLADHVAGSVSQFGASRVPVNRGTGKFSGYRGTTISTPIKGSNNSDLTIRVHR